MAKGVMVNLRHLKLTQVQLASLNANMDKVGEAVRELNEDQIAKFKEATGKHVRPYSDFKWGGQTYYERKGTSRGKVDYTSKEAMLSENQRGKGHMMDFFGVIKKGLGYVEIGFNDTDSNDKAGWNYKLRKFIGLTKANKKKLFKWIRQTFIEKAFT